MTDPNGALAFQRTGDVAVFDGIQWQASGNLQTPAMFRSPGGQIVSTSTPGWTFVNANRINIFDGSSSSPVSAERPSFQVTRWEAQGSGQVQNGAIQGVVIANNTLAGGTSQAIRGYAEQRNASDIVGIDSTSVIASGATGSGQAAYGFYTAVADFTGAGYVVGVNPALQVTRDQAYTTTAPFSNGVFVQGLLASGGTTGQAYRIPFAYGVYANTPTDVLFDVGYAAIKGVKSAAFRDDTAALIGLDLHGSGYNAGVDLTNATINSGGSQVKLKGGVAYTPTITSQVGTYTTVSSSGHYLLLGKLLYISLVITQTNVGTASGSIRFSLPLSLTSRDGTALAAYDASGLTACTGQIATGSGVVNIFSYDGNSTVPVIVTGHFIVVSGVIEVA